MTDSIRHIDFADDDVNPSAANTPTIGPDPLEALRAALTAEIERPDLTLSVPARPGVSIRFSTNIDMDMVQMWRKRSNDKNAPENFNLLKFSSLIIANQAKSILANGQEPEKSINFGSEEVLTWTGAKRPLEAVRLLYGVDGHIIATAGEVMEAAGFGDEMQEDDDRPTSGF